MHRSAGVIVVRCDDGVWKMLCLRLYNSWDVPKGSIEEGESEFVAAIRETKEEAGLSDISFPWGKSYEVFRRMKKESSLDTVVKKEVMLFVGTTQQEPVIAANPVSGKFEHHGYAWLTFDEAEKKLNPYLRPCATWARAVVESSLKECLKLDCD